MIKVEVSPEIQRQAEELALATGEETTNLKMASTDWGRRMREGVIVTVHVGRERFQLGMAAEHLGIPAEELGQELTEELIKLGKISLIPRALEKKAAATEKAIRKLILDRGFMTSYGPFLPAEVYVEVKKELKPLVLKYMNVRDSIIANYAGITTQTRLALERMARKTYARLCKIRPETINDESEFVQQFVTNLLGHFPSQETIFQSFYVELDLAYIPMPSAVAAEVARATEIENEVQERAAASAARRMMRQAEAELAAEQVRLETAKTRTATDEYLEALREMNRDALEDAKRRSSQVVEKFEADIKATVYNRLLDVAADVLGAIQKTGKLHPRKVVQLKNLVKQAGTLNFSEDGDVEAALNRVAAELKLSAGVRSTSSVEEAMESIVIVMRQNLVDIGQHPRISRDLNLPEPTPETITLARRQIRSIEVPAPLQPSLQDMLDARPRSSRKL